jgi:hypothetical protein
VGDSGVKLVRERFEHGFLVFNASCYRRGKKLGFYPRVGARFETETEL